MLVQPTKVAILIFGGVVGTENSAKTTITNCYYLEGTCKGAVNLQDIKEKAESRTVSQMQEDSFVDTLNSGNTEGEQVWAKDNKNQNGGYPVFK